MDGDTGGVVVEAAPPAEAVEAASGAAVEVAQIQADRDIAIAEVASETQQAATEAVVAVAEIEAEQEDEDVRWLRNELETLQARCGTLEAGLSSVTEQLNATQAQLSEAVGMMAEHMATLTPPAHSPVVAEEVPPAQPSEERSEAAHLEAATPAEEAPPIPRVKKRVWL